VRWNLSVVLISISFMARNSEHFFIPTSAVGVRLQFPVFAFQICWEVGFQSVQGLCWIMFLEGR
jgi:hypothetical protein